MKRILRRTLAITVSTAIGAVTLLAAVVAGLSQADSTPDPTGIGTAAGLPHETGDLSGRTVVAIVLGSSGSDAADALVPYEVFARSPQFAVVTVAETLDPAPLDGGLWVRPDVTFADIANGTAPRPDLIVVPAVTSPSDGVEAPARTFISETYAAGAKVLGVCAGARLLAASGILNGKSATSHWSRLGALEQSNPEVDWVRGERYVQDGSVTTTGGVTSSVFGSLRVMADIAGDAEAQRVGGEIAYPGWSLHGPVAMPANSFGASDAGVLANTAFPWGRPTVEIEVTDGVGEIDAAALFEVYTYSQAAATRAVSASGSVTTEHGLVLLTESPSDKDRLQAGALVSSHGFGGFDAAFERLAADVRPDEVTSVAKMLEYPLARVEVRAGTSLSAWRGPLLALVAVGVAVSLAVMPVLIRRRRRRASPQ